MESNIPRQEALIIDQVLDTLKAELGDALVGVLATGSRVHGRGDKNSDIDLDVLVTFPRRQRRMRLVDGVDVEILLNPEREVLRSLEMDRAQARGSYHHMWMTGVAVHDPLGAVARLREIARRGWDKGPPPLNDVQRWRLRQSQTAALRDIEDVIERDEAQASFALGACLRHTVETYMRRRRGWSVTKPKRTIDDLAEVDPVAAILVRAGCVGTLEERFEAYRALVDHTLRDLGGLVPRGSVDGPWQPTEESPATLAGTRPAPARRGSASPAAPAPARPLRCAPASGLSAGIS